MSRNFLSENNPNLCFINNGECFIQDGNYATTFKVSASGYNSFLVRDGILSVKADLLCGFSLTGNKYSDNNVEAGNFVMFGSVGTQVSPNKWSFAVRLNSYAGPPGTAFSFQGTAELEIRSMNQYTIKGTSFGRQFTVTSQSN